MLALILALVACQHRSPTDAEANPDQTSYPDLPDLDDAIAAVMESDAIPGLAACLVKGEAIVWCQGYGEANIEAGLAVTPDTPFMLASASKAVVGMALMHAVETGLLDLDTPVSDVVGFDVVHPDFPGKEITTRMVAAHVSGVADNWDVMDALYTDGDPVIPLDSFLEGYLTPGGDYYDDWWNFTADGPKGAYEYSNIGAALAGLVVQEAAGQPFDAYCDEHLFAPLGLEQTAWMLADLDEDGVAMPYTFKGGEYHAEGQYGFPDYPSGQLRAGAEPVARLLGAVMNGGAFDGVRLLSEGSVSELLDVQFSGLDEDQGVFWYRWDLDGEEVWGHNGGETGVSTETGFWDDGTGFVVLMNAEGGRRTLEDVEAALREAAAGL